MTISKYCTIRFVLDCAYEDHAALVNPDWHNWLISISRMFSHRIPQALLHGLLRKNNSHIEQFCIERLNKLAEPINESKYEKWLERRDMGNKKAQENS